MNFFVVPTNWLLIYTDKPSLMENDMSNIAQSPALGAGRERKYSRVFIRKAN